jgi:glucose-6-phosphate isomerase
MPLREPVICPVSASTGRLDNASGRYEKRLSDLAGLYENSVAFAAELSQGVMLLESPDGEVRALPIGPRDIVYVPPYWIHRSVNVGNDDLVMTFAYPADSGQDYAIIERSGGMRSRVVASEDGWALADNTAYRPRARAETDALFANNR